MEQSLFSQWVDKWFGPIIKKITEKVNGKKTAPVYLFKAMLTKSYSPTLKWGTLSKNGKYVAADVVSMDSSLPLKKRDSIAKHEGDIPKIGMKMYMNERTMSDLNILVSQNQGGSRNAEITRKLFEDTKKCIYGVYEKLEYMFLQAFSTGVTSIVDENNTGTEIRVDFGHPDANKYGVGSKWDNANAKPITDIEHVVSQASRNGDTIRFIYMDRIAFNNFKTKAEVKELFAANLGFAGQNIPVPTLTQINDAFNSNYGIQIILIDRHVNIEKNGKIQSVKPWADGVVVFTTTQNVGSLQYGTLAEETHKAKQVAYQKTDDYILVSKYHKVDPLREFTSSQALVIPVIDELDNMYIMNTSDAEEDAQTEGDANFNYKGTDYTKASVVAAINLANEDLNAKETNADSTLQSKINKLSDEEIEVFEANITAV